MWLGCLRPLGTSSLVRSDTVRLDAFALPPGVLYFVGRGMRLFQDARRTTHRVAIVVYDSTAPAGIGQGVSIEARADEQEIIHALHALERRGWKKPLQEVREASIHRVYKAVPEHLWNSTVGSPEWQRFDTRVAVDLLRKEGWERGSARGRPSRACGRQKARH